MSKDLIISNAEELAQKVRKELYPKRYKWLTQSIGFPMLLGLGTLITLSLYSYYPKSRDFVLSFQFGVITTILVYLWQQHQLSANEKLVEGKVLTRVTEDIVKNLQVSSVYNTLAQKHIKEQWHMSTFFESLVDKTTENGGGFVISANTRNYSSLLREAMEISELSFHAILRGGVDERYKPSEIFKKNNGENYKIISDDIKVYLKQVNNIGSKSKIRILLYNYDTFMNEFSKPDLREEFLKYFCHKSIDVFWASPESLKEFDRYEKYWIEDYAVIDARLILRHNASSELLITSMGEMDCYCGIFKQLREDIKFKTTDRFMPITENEIGGMSWDDFDNIKEKENAHEFKKFKDNKSTPNTEAIGILNEISLKVLDKICGAFFK